MPSSTEKKLLADVCVYMLLSLQLKQSRKISFYYQNQVDFLTSVSQVHENPVFGHSSIWSFLLMLVSHAVKKGIFSWNRLRRALSSLSSNVFGDRASTTSLCNLIQCFSTLTVGYFFLLSYLNVSSFSVKPLPLSYPTDPNKKSVLVFLTSPL